MQSFRRQVDLSCLFTFKNVSAKTQSHLTQVYTLLMTTALVCAMGMYVNSTFVVSGFFLNLLSVIGSIFLVYQTLNRANSEDTRKAYLAGLAFQLGFLVGPALHYLVEFEPTIVLQAVLYTAAAFISFSALSLFSQRRSYLFLGAIIITLIQGMALYRLFAYFFGYSLMPMTYLMVGLLTACLYIIYDTQIIIERAELGDKDVVGHALLLFIDLFDLFIKILKILIKLSQDDKDKKKNKK